VCPEGWFETDERPACFGLLMPDFTDAFDAASLCASFDAGGVRARLPTPRDVAELDVLALVCVGNPCWVGATDLETEGTFAFTDVGGSPLPFEPGSDEWATGEPNDGGGREDCLEWSIAMGFNDLACSAGRQVACEITAGWAVADRCDGGQLDPGEECEGPVAAPMACEGCNLVCPSGNAAWKESFSDHVCFGRLADGVNQVNAVAACGDAEARVATPDDPVDIAVTRYVCEGADPPSGHCWLGASSALGDGNFVWDSGEPFDYPPNEPPWEANEPNGTGRALVLDQGFLRDVQIDGPHHALCEVGDGP
jgi:hypothetical protein